MAENPIFAVNTRVAQLRAAGADIVALTAGEPQVATEPGIVAAAQAAVADPATHHYGPAQGEPALRDVIAGGLTPAAGAWSRDDVVVTLGAKHAIHLAVLALAAPGDDVLIVEPGWPGHASAVRAAGANPVAVRTATDGQLSEHALAMATTDRSRAIIIASPANPTGAVLNYASLDAVARWAQDGGRSIISDDVYSAFDYSDSYQHLLTVAPELRESTVIVDSVSKEHAMTGWRIGWLAASTPVVRRATVHLSATITNVPRAMQHAATAALADPAGPAAAKAVYRNRRDRIVAALADVDGVDCPTPDGGMFVFPSVRGILEARAWTNSAPLVDELIDAGVAVVPGEAFDAPDRIRICYAVDDDVLDTAIDRLRETLQRSHALAV